MCEIIYKGDIEIGSPKELKAVYPNIQLLPSGDIDDDLCLCQIDIEKTLSNAGIMFASLGDGEYIINKQKK